MKLCERGLNFLQVYDDYGNVRLCAWIVDGSNIGNLLDSSVDEVFHGEKAQSVRNRLGCGDYSKCIIDNCPWLSCNEMDKHLVEIDECPKYPEYLYLAFENACNYNCITCNMHERMLATDKIEINKRYEKIVSEIKKVMPYVKRISANGQGELFASERTLELLSQWEPIAPAEECSVVLETNGSLFDEEHWKKIENLGKYHLTVCISIMSFNEQIYQRLSGTKLPIEKLFDNLRFVKELREKEIINELRICTVVQQSNFREMPEFARRSIEEFGADYVRLRSFVPWGKRPIETEWFMDVRNPYHPDHEEYVEIMKHPIFNHPAVHDWSGGRGTLLGPHPNMKKLEIANKKEKITNLFLDNEKCIVDMVSRYIPEKSTINIYGVGVIGKLLFKALKEYYQVHTFIDKYVPYDCWSEVPILRLSDKEKAVISEREYIIVTPLNDTNEIIEFLSQEGIDKSKIFGIDKIICVD